MKAPTKKKIAAALEAVLDGVVRIKQIDAPLTKDQKRVIRSIRKSIRAYCKGGPK